MAETHEELAILAGSTDLLSELGPPQKQMACVLSLWEPRVVPHRYSYLPWEGWTAACPCHLALVQLPGDLGYVLARRGGGLDVIHSGHMDHRRARRRRHIHSQKMAGFPESLSKDSAPALLPASPSLFTAQGSLQASILSLHPPQGLTAFGFSYHCLSLLTPRSL